MGVRNLLYVGHRVDGIVLYARRKAWPISFGNSYLHPPHWQNLYNNGDAGSLSALFHPCTTLRRFRTWVDMLLNGLFRTVRDSRTQTFYESNPISLFHHFNEIMSPFDCNTFNRDLLKYPDLFGDFLFWTNKLILTKTVSCGSVLLQCWIKVVK